MSYIFQTRFGERERTTFNIILSDPETGVNDNSASDQGILKSRTIEDVEVGTFTGVEMETPIINSSPKLIEGITYATGSVISITVYNWTAGRKITIELTAVLNDNDRVPINFKLRIV